MEQNFDLFFKANESRIHYQILRLGTSSEDYAELYAEGIVALWAGYKQYNTTKGNLGTFLNYQIRYRLLDIIRRKNRVKDGDGKVTQEVKTKLDDGNRYCKTGETIPDTSGIILDRKDFWDEVKCLLSDKQWQWVEYFIIADLSVKEIMEIEGVSQEAVKGWAKEVRRKLRHEEIRVKLERLL